MAINKCNVCGEFALAQGEDICCLCADDNIVKCDNCEREVITRKETYKCLNCFCYVCSDCINTDDICIDCWRGAGGKG